MACLYSILRRLVTLLPLLFLSACSFSLAADITPPPGAEVPAVMPIQPAPSGPLSPLVPPNPATGEAIFAEKCAPCHGVNGQGDGLQAAQLPNPPTALGSPEVARQARLSDWYTVVTQGNLERFMPPFSSLTDRQRWDVVAYAYSLGTSPQAIVLGQELYQANCASCHGEGGLGDGQTAVSLSTRPTNFKDQESMAGISDADLFQAISAGVEPDMPAFGDQLSEDERWALAAYLRSLTFVQAGETASLQATTSPQPSAVAGTAEAPQASTTPALGLGTIRGEVTNASGGDLPSGVTVTLHGFDNMQASYTATATVQPDGTYIFKNIEMPTGRAFIASVEYQDVAYNSDASVVKAGTTELDLPIPIYESTSDTSALSVDRLHYLLEYTEPETLHVVELYIISNSSDRTVIAEEKGAPVLTFRLPEGATNLQFQDGALGERYVEVSGGFGDMAAVRPGMSQHQIVFSYDLPYKRRIELVQPNDLPVNAVVVLLPEDGLTVKSEQLQDAGTRDVQGVAYRMYTGEQLDPGSELAMTISGRPGRSISQLVSGSSSDLLIGAVALGLALVVAGVWLYRRNQARATAPVDQATGAGWTAGEEMDDAETLLDAILALDDQFQAGELSEEAYRRRRAELKSRLKEMLGS